MSTGALAILVLGHLPPGVATLPTEEVRFQARWKLSGDPLLVQAVLLQLGEKHVQKSEPAQRTPVDVVQSTLVRLAAYRDELPTAWEEFLRAPLRTVLQLCPLLTACDKLSCSCPAFHKMAHAGEPDPILEVFGRQFLFSNLKQAPADKAEVYNAVLRVPLVMEVELQAFSGLQGLYFEPRGDSIREPSDRFSVIWMPRLDHSQALILRQTQPDALGLARVADRYEVRCLKSQAESLHKALKPGVPYLPAGSATLFHAGPWPYGLQRPAINKAFRAFGWAANATQPVPGAASGGQWWAVHAENPPPSNVMPSQVGDVLIVMQPAKPELRKVSTPVIASQAVLQQLQTGPPVAVSAPVEPAFDESWAAYLHKRGTPSSSPEDRPAVVDQVAKQVLGKLQETPAATAVEQWQGMATALHTEVLQHIGGSRSNAGGSGGRC